MTGRPEQLFPLFAGLETLPGVGPKTAKLLANLAIAAPRDLLFTLPSSGVDRAPVASVQDAALPGVVTVPVTIGRHIPPMQRGRPYRIEVEDAKTTFQVVYFRGAAELHQRLLPTGQRRILSGKAELYDGIAQMPHPDHVLSEGEALPAYEPVYPLTAGITAKVMAKAVAGALSRVPPLAEWIDPNLMAERGWPTFAQALQEAHHPLAAADLSPASMARQRLAYDELFAHQLTLALARTTERSRPGQVTEGSGRLRRKVLAVLPFQPTGAQQRSVDEIADDMARPRRMNRLLQGDVGSGKTLVALMALLTAVEAGGQGVLMAPTEILARQHAEGLRPLADAAGVVLELLTGRDKGREREAKLSALANGDIHILVGTHAVFQRDVTFADLRLAVIDEQHRFGVRQRMLLGEKNAATDVLVMTATPIPRSLALTQYGDMDLSVLDEKPPGRTPVQTATVPVSRMDDVIAKLRAAVAEGRQAYWVCPLVEESEVIDATSAEERFRSLRAALGDGAVGLVHGQMAPADKDAAMAAFVAGRTSVLVATTVIEVGVNVPNASIMVIERADTFGLAQLHQLRGRVGRGAAASTCLLMYKAPLGDTAEARLRILRESEDGFRISEEDLALRGAGDVIGTAQSGLPRFRVADLERQAALMATAQTDARALLAADPDLSSPRGQAARLVLWLMEQDRALRLLRVG
ncbi:ATP-dependent DNA helicase RecG [Jannaschia pagri]|uniref:Probable DNA 3'-5' helicase RecG n=1 Tax=Jannaschia pagri TaxID=2829797 RepID=A0ABQ4NNK1_9RHOB|nr:MULTISPECIES: ATP-dependent DNA helicase RecG [unclassified Jannaschia]GIT92141.1 ATP-dependent DNA helicase RecG [Jannaschia sp. AI_61]GIT95976.1 ATP-dependent DNA helicase RecG [Jannaschia sp. AI_62]